MRPLCLFAVLLAGLTGPLAMAAAPALVVSAGGATRQFTSDELLTRHDAATLAIPHDPAYGGVVSYRAVPLRALLSELPPDAGDTIQARATDGFVAELPRALIGGMATPWVAVEDSAHPWPHLRGKTVSAGPFYLVWQDAERARISTEQWAYALAALTVVPSPVQRWPVIAVDASVPEDAPARRGQTAFIANCPLPSPQRRRRGDGRAGSAAADAGDSVFHRSWPARIDSQSRRCAQLARATDASLRSRYPGRCRGQCNYRLFALFRCSLKVSHVRRW